MLDASEVQRRYIRQKRTVTILAVVLIIVGVIVLFVLRRLPIPIRIMAGLGDVFVGCVLLVLVRQQGQKS